MTWLQRHENTEVLGPLFAYARAHASQLVRFVVIGAGLAAVNLSLLYGLRTWLRLPDAIAVGAMYGLGAVLHFVAHRWITYGAQDQPLYPQGLRYAVMFVSNLAMLQGLVAVAARLSVTPYVAVVVSIGLTMIGNFLFMTHVVFSTRRRR